MNTRAAVSPALNQLKSRFAFFAVAILFVLSLMNARSANAQYASQATIPFAFSANHRAFPLGQYRVFRESEDYLKVVSTETGNAALLMVRTSRRLEVQPKNSLVFLHDERGYHLTTVRFAQGDIGLQTDLSVQPKAEREIAKAPAGAITEVGMN